MAVKNEVAALLEQRRGTAVSGQELADMLGVSRAAVWKAVKQLQDEGYRISAATNRGYLLENETDVLSADGIRLNLPERYRELPVKVYRSVGSTNTEAKAAALRGMPHGTIIAADEQTAGRGRFGKSFYSPARSGLYMSVIQKPQKPVSDCTLITAAAACAVTDSLEELCGVRAGIKWVNDIFLGGRKISGILTEAISDFESGTVEAIGWNRYGGWRIGIRSFDSMRYYYYAHLRKNKPYISNLKEGDIVKAGDVIGYLGMTGYSTKENVNNINVPHLHFGMQLIFDEVQKDGNNEIWIDVYEIVEFLNKNRTAVNKNGDGYERKNNFTERSLVENGVCQ